MKLMKPSEWVWRKYNDILQHEQKKVGQIHLTNDVKLQAAFGAILLLLDAALGDIEVADPEDKEPPP